MNKPNSFTRKYPHTFKLINICFQCLFYLFFRLKFPVYQGFEAVCNSDSSVNKITVSEKNFPKYSHSSKNPDGGTFHTQT
jgi:hypothetical protein